MPATTQPPSHAIPMATLRRVIGAIAPTTGDFPTCIADLSVYRRNAPAPPMTCIIDAKHRAGRTGRKGDGYRQ